MDRVTVAIAIGSNEGPRQAHLEFASHSLGRLLTDLRVSPSIETLPEGVPDRQPRFLNAAAVGQTTLSPNELLAALLAIEGERGRRRPFPGASRSLDLDLVLFGDAVIEEEGLVVPHPRFRERRFVLEPLAQIAPHLRDPVTGRTIGELLDRLRPER